MKTGHKTANAATLHLVRHHWLISSAEDIWHTRENNISRVNQGKTVTGKQKRQPSLSPTVDTVSRVYLLYLKESTGSNHLTHSYLQLRFLLAFPHYVHLAGYLKSWMSQRWLSYLSLQIFDMSYGENIQVLFCSYFKYWSTLLIIVILVYKGTLEIVPLI